MICAHYNYNYVHIQKQPFRRVLRKSCVENMQEIYRTRVPPKFDLNKVAKKEHLWTTASACCCSCLFVNFYLVYCSFVTSYTFFFQFTISWNNFGQIE